MNDEDYMRMTLAKAREGIEKGNSPFGASIVKDWNVIALTHNQVWEHTDITAHAEIIAIREACRNLGVIDLGGAVLYSSCEPCPMCFSAAHWANISRVVFGASIQDAQSAGFRELAISNGQMKLLSRSTMEVAGPLLLDEAQELFRYWSSLPGRRAY
ncbi:MAG: nucleoside deaminase [Planctomycetota bacterium]|jgi:tRNA(Arg) A34 adenosine deaminase TadA